MKKKNTLATVMSLSTKITHAVQACVILRTVVGRS